MEGLAARLLREPPRKGRLITMRPKRGMTLRRHGLDAVSADGFHVSVSSKQAGLALCAKRIMDVAFAALVLILALPLLIITAVAIKLDSTGPVLFRQKRVGRCGRPFRMLKFRSMVNGASPELHKQYVKGLLRDGENRDAVGRSERTYKLAEDPRVTRVGRVIRRLSIDELPQLFNVLRGDMSLVGPRPDVPYAVEEYEPWQWQRFEVLPGITGLWQVSGRSELSPTEMLRLDVEYVERYSVWLDCILLLRTIPVVLRKVGSS